MKIATHPGAVLWEDYLEPLGLTQVEFARSIGISLQRVNEIINEKRGVTTETALLFAQAFETSPQFWMNLQTGYDLASSRGVSKVKSVLRHVRR